MYEKLDKSKRWKISSSRYVEEVMQESAQILDYEHPSCSMILQIDDDHWFDFFTTEELNEIKAATENNVVTRLPDNMKNFLNTIPRTANIKEIICCA
ncbi:hypothetical protein RMATCC62417_05712 [Rhizopus microsporus]|nr:hypothetical protein RMATCC62417_05712 [Rhizopus microsporus]